MDNKLISVIVPVFNTGKYLINCVNSIIRQTYSNLEILLIDDGSETQTYDLCDELAQSDSRIRVIHQRNGGLSSARNTGISASSGDYITFVDSDDYLSYTLYEELLSLSTPNSLVTSHFVRVDEDGNVYKRNDPFLTHAISSVENFVENLLLHKADVSVCTKLFPREIIGDTRFICGKANEDLLFLIEILKKVQSVYFTGRVGYFYLKRSGSLSSGYGKAVIDMIDNSLFIQHEVYNHWPNLQEQAIRFVVYQHMAYVLLVPISEISCNSTYKGALFLLRRYFMPKVILNKYLTFKQKLIIGAICFLPKITAVIYQKKNIR